MNNLNVCEVILNHETATVCVNGKDIGTINWSINPFHNEHFYLKLQLRDYDISVSNDIFNVLRQKLNKPLQVMISSNEQDIVSFLSMAGFSCKRKCYEVEASVQDYIGSKTKRPVSFSSVGSSIYKKCCEMMLESYILTHARISPWTGSPEQFFDILPKTVYYETDDQQIVSFAFVENNEIAYVYGTDVKEFAVFAQSIITELFGQHEYVWFEADDCDDYAMELRKLFVNQSNESFDTYIL